MPKEPRWHQKVKDILKELGEKEDYDVSESEKEILLSSRFKRFVDEKRQIHAFAFRPDVVWKKGHLYRAIFEVEYLSPRSKAQLMEKRKYAIGSLMLAYLAMVQKSIENLVFITNNEALCAEIAKFVQLADIEHFNCISYLAESTNVRSSLAKSLKKVIAKEWKI